MASPVARAVVDVCSRKTKLKARLNRAAKTANAIFQAGRFQWAKRIYNAISRESLVVDWGAARSSQQPRSQRSIHYFVDAFSVSCQQLVQRKTCKSRQPNMECVLPGMQQ